MPNFPDFRRSDNINNIFGRGDEKICSIGSRGDLVALNRLIRIFYYTMMVKRLLLNSGFWQQRNAEIPTFLSHDSSNGSIWVKIFSKNQYLVKVGGTQQECDYQALLKILERRSIQDDVFSDARAFFLKEKKKPSFFHAISWGTGQKTQAESPQCNLARGKTFLR